MSEPKEMTVEQLKARWALQQPAAAAELEKCRADLKAVVDTRIEALTLLDTSAYFTDEEKRVGKREIRDKTDAEIERLIGELQKAEKRARSVARDLLESGGGSTAQASEAVRRLLDSGVAPAEIVARAKELRDETTLRALRKELRYFAPSPGKLNDDQAQAAIAGLQTEIDYTLADVLPGEDGKIVRGALALEKEADAAAATAEFAAKASSDNASGTARMELGFAQNDAERARAAVDNGNGSGDSGGIDAGTQGARK
jgi:hypothetical protein